MSYLETAIGNFNRKTFKEAEQLLNIFSYSKEWFLNTNINKKNIKYRIPFNHEINTWTLYISKENYKNKNFVHCFDSENNLFIDFFFFKYFLSNLKKFKKSKIIEDNYICKVTGNAMAGFFVFNFLIDLQSRMEQIQSDYKATNGRSLTHGSIEQYIFHNFYCDTEEKTKIMVDVIGL